MKRWIFLAAVVILASTWSTPARAQYGMGGFGNNTDPTAQIDQERSKITQNLHRYSQAPASHTRASRPKLTNPSSLDAYGRMDLAGRPVGGYPVVRGDLHGHIGSSLPRGGANSPHSRPAHRRK